MPSNDRTDNGDHVPQNWGIGELILVLAIVMLVFGASRLPQLGDGIGKAIRNFKRGLNTDDEIEVQKKLDAKDTRALGDKASRVSDATDADIVDRKS